MSHISENITCIKEANETILREALQQILEENAGLALSKEVSSFEGTKQKVDVAIRHEQKLPYGLGINYQVQGDGLRFVGDSYAYEPEYTRMRELLVQTYNVVATKHALASLGYRATARQEAGTNKMILEAVRA